MESQLTSTELATEIRSRYQQLKEAVKRGRPWDPDVEFLRQQVRRSQLQMLFKHPSAKESKDVDNQLWMTTSHAFIVVYKGHLASLDKERLSPQPQNGKGKPHKNIVERRRLAQRFRQFLNSEDKFWRHFIARYTQFFDIDDKNAVLQNLHLGEFQQADDGSERNLFPDASAVEAPPKQSDNQNHLAIVSKALVCLGDLTRYREQQGEQTKTEQAAARGGRGGRPISSSAHRLPYSKSQELYEMARSLVPDSGNSSHQLAIISNYQKDTFSAVYHYYRALCVRFPYEPASENLQTTFNKAIDVYLKTRRNSETEYDVNLPSKELVERLKEKAVVLHASWRMSPEESAKKFNDLQSSFITDFTSLVSDRSLPVEVILKILVMAMGALWRIRMLRDSKKEVQEARTSEFRIATHLLSLLTSLLRIGVLQVSDGPEAVGGSSDLAMNITAVFRRLLPALRIGSKWMRVHLAYIMSLSSSYGISSELKTKLLDLWAAYQTFYNNLWKAFPLKSMPTLTNPLEEDVDLSGYMPLKRVMTPPSFKSVRGLDPGQGQVHPNEEQLMRISDLLHDALYLSKAQKSPIDFQDSRFIFRGLEPLPQAPSSPRPISATTAPKPMMIPPAVASHALLQSSQKRVEPKEEADDDSATVSTRTEDDPVNLAMTATLDSDQDAMEEDEILYPKQAVHTPLKSFATISPRLTATATPSISPRLQLSGSPNGQLYSVTPRNVSGFDHEQLQPAVDSSWAAAAQPALLFGSKPGESHSIWSTTHDIATPLLATQSLGRSSLPSFQGTGWPPPAKPGPPQKQQHFQADSPSNFLSRDLRGSMTASYSHLTESYDSLGLSFSEPFMDRGETLYTVPYQSGAPHSRPLHHSPTNLSSMWAPP